MRDRPERLSRTTFLSDPARRVNDKQQGEQVTIITTTTSSTWPNDPTENASFKDWQYEVANGDTILGFRDWLTANKDENATYVASVIIDAPDADTAKEALSGALATISPDTATARIEMLVERD